MPLHEVKCAHFKIAWRCMKLLQYPCLLKAAEPLMTAFKWGTTCNLSSNGIKITRSQSWKLQKMSFLICSSWICYTILRQKMFVSTERISFSNVLILILTLNFGKFWRFPSSKFQIRTLFSFPEFRLVEQQGILVL